MDLTGVREFREHFVLLAQVRFQTFENLIRRNTQKKFELVFRVLAWLLLAGLAVIIGLAMFGAVYGMLPRFPLALAISLWFVFLGWQLIPVLFETFAPNLNFSEIACYPISFPLFFTLSLVYGLLEPAAIAAILWLVLIWIAVLLVDPWQALRALLVFPLFALCCLLLNRVLMEWVQRVVSSRRGRTAISVVLGVFALGSQVLIYGMEPQKMKPYLGLLAGFWRVFTHYLPPGMAGVGVALGGAWFAAALLMLIAGVLLLALLLRRQLWRIYAGENRSESRQQSGAVQSEPGWKLPLCSDSSSALVEKEVRYLVRNPMLLMNLVMMWGFVLIFAFSGKFARLAFGVSHTSRALYFYPGAIFYCMLSLTPLAFNSFGSDPPGFQRWFLLPLDLRSVLRGKNALLLLVTLANWLVVTATAVFLVDASALQAFSMLLLSFYLMLGFATVGNLLSVWFPKRMGEQRWQAKNVSEAAVMIGMVVFAVLGGTSGSLIFAQKYFGVTWLLPLALPVLCMVLWLVYRSTLGTAARRMKRKREAMLQELG